MHDILSSFALALSLIAGGDAELWRIVALSLEVSLASAVFALRIRSMAFFTAARLPESIGTGGFAGASIDGADLFATLSCALCPVFLSAALRRGAASVFACGFCACWTGLAC